MYRGFIKNINALNGNAIGTSGLRIQEMKIKRDILTKASSTFVVVEIPNAASEGDVFGVYDDYGNIVYEGVITSIEDNEIQANQIVALFDDKWLWNDPQETTLEQTIKTILTEDFVNNEDTKIANTFSQFNITTSSSTELYLLSQEEKTVKNFMSFIYELYENYGILIDINIGYRGQPTINIGVPSFTKLKVSDNNNSIRNLNVVTETAQTNKLIVYSNDGKTQRGIYYATTSGITDDSSALNRLAKVNTNIVFSDDEIGTIIADNLSEEMYNHKITLDLVLNSKLYKWEDFHLGQLFDIFYNGKVYESVLTGYTINVQNDGKADIVNLTFGKVRQTIESKLYKEFTKIVEQKTQEQIPISSQFKILGVEVSHTNMAAGNVLTNQTKTFTPDSGYVAIGIVGTEKGSGSDGGRVEPYRYSVSGNTLTYSIHNPASASQNVSIKFNVLEVYTG